MRRFLGLMLVVLAGAPIHAFANEIGVDELPPAAPAVPAFSANDSCPVEISHQAPEDYYPPGSIRRSESGEVLIEFTAEVGAAHPRDVVVVQGQWFPGSRQCGTQARSVARSVDGLRRAAGAALHRVRGVARPPRQAGIDRLPGVRPGYADGVDISLRRVVNFSLRRTSAPRTHASRAGARFRRACPSGCNGCA